MMISAESARMYWEDHILKEDQVLKDIIAETESGIINASMKSHRRYKISIKDLHFERRENLERILKMYGYKIIYAVNDEEYFVITW